MIKEADIMKNKLPIALIVIGVLIFSYPLLERLYTYVMQQRVLANYEDNQSLSEALLTDEANSNTYEEYLALEELFQNPAEEEIEEVPVIDQPAINPLTPMGIIKIGKINLKLPIYDGTSERYLKVGSGRIKGTSNIGEIGNIALAGHRSRTFGRFFNRLNELEIGDEIIIEEGNKTYVYTVYKTHIVEPTDITVLYRNNKDRVLTLVTCDPVEVSTHRLIVHAVLR